MIYTQNLKVGGEGGEGSSGNLGPYLAAPSSGPAARSSAAVSATS